MMELVDPRDAFASTLLGIARHDERVCLVLNDSLSSSNARGFLSEFPDRVFDAGIAEQNMVGVAAGLANAGMVPFVCAASCFLTGRALEQIKIDVALSRANVKLCGFSSGFAYGSLGPTHHSIEDLAWVRVLPNLRVAAPCDDHETAAVVTAAHAYVGPVFIRVNRLPVPSLLAPDHTFEFGSSLRMREGSDLTLIGMGFTTHRALAAAKRLAKAGVECRVINMSTISPLDVKAIVDASRETGRIVCIEDHLVDGGLFSAVAGVVVQNAPAPMLGIGVPGVFASVGSTEDLLEEFGLTEEQIAGRVMRWLGSVNAREEEGRVYA